MTRAEVLAGRDGPEPPNAICACGIKFRRGHRDHRYCSPDCAAVH